ncbi:MAG: hypothetical protein H6812_13535 [Phycisphaeraceae bacterium]|nr:hypothetical protein [Phycisphaerales bacterium]MCB9844260.1 hypothetical protein [Phycisphaeraceae bacterium]
MKTRLNRSLAAFASAGVVLALAGTANAAATNVHITGDFPVPWGLWITGLFEATPSGAGTHYAFADGGSGNPMDFMMTLPDGTPVDGSDVTMRMFSADTVGNVGDPELGLTSWSVWVSFPGDVSVHVIWNSSSSALALANLGSTGKDGVEYGAFGLNEQLNWTLSGPGGTVENFATNFDSFSITVPTPGAAAILGLAGLTASRRRR